MARTESASRAVAHAVLSVEGFAVRFPDGTPVALDVALDLLRGQVVSLLGPSGGGKTTVVRALLAPDALRAEGFAVTWRRRDLSAEPAFVPQRGALLDHLDVVGNVALARAAAGVADDSADWLTAVELDDSIAAPGRPVSALSGGQAQRVAVARTLAAGRRLLVLDEPSVGLDHLGVRRLARLLVKQAREHDVAVLVITHDLALAGGASDTVLFLDQAHQALVVVDPGWPGPAELAAADERSVSLASLEARVDELLGAERPPAPAAARPRRRGALLAPLRMAAVGLGEAATPRLFAQAMVVMLKAFVQALAKPMSFYAVVGALLGFTIPFAMVHVTAGLKERSVLAVIGGSYILSLAPPISAIVFAATSGSAINAWLGGLRLHGQILALEGVGVRPGRYLWSPAWIALAVSYLATVALFIASMVAGGWVLFGIYDVPDALARLVSTFTSPPPEKVAPVVRGAWLVLAYALALPSIVVAKAAEAKDTSGDVTAAMTSAVKRCTIFVVVMELVSVWIMYRLSGRH
ncbi:MAG: ATP-binding cassette domain-containing protein [Deltaproteobacteria bacterium]|nr:ATP-binding cassette domain-containing protein [Deltaproteobacteria bacterium]